MQTRIVRYLFPILLALLGLRLLIDAACDLVPDEAFYWTWTRHLAGGYFDHPPLIAYVLWLSTRIFGNTALGVRFPAALMSIASVGVLVLLANRLLRDKRAAGFVALMWIVGPLLAVTGTICTPDAPATFFSVCALACAALIADRDNPDVLVGRALRAESSSPAARERRAMPALLWLAFGCFSGPALLSKYTAVLVPSAVALAFLTSPAGRRHYTRPWIYLSGIIALLVFSPDVYWNAKHHWASFLFQLHHGAAPGEDEIVRPGLDLLLHRFAGLAEFVGGQALVWTPILFGVAVFVLVKDWRKYTALRSSDRVLLWCGTLPLLLFGWAATRSRGEINWPAFAYYPLSILTARWLSENWAGGRVHLVRKGCEVALGMTIGLHVLATPPITRLLFRLHVPVPHQVTDLFGGREFGRQLAERADGAPVVCNRHQDAGEAAFYLPGQPDVWCESVGSRPTAFDFFDTGRPDYAKIPRLLFMGTHVREFQARFDYPEAQALPKIALPGPGKNRTKQVQMMERRRVQNAE